VVDILGKPLGLHFPHSMEVPARLRLLGSIIRSTFPLKTTRPDYHSAAERFWDYCLVFAFVTGDSRKQHRDPI
jgi:hypothetical protein